MKYLLSFVVVLLGFMWWKSQRKGDSLAKSKERAAPRSAGAKPIIEMATCAKCGLHVPASEAVAANNRLFCSPEHADG